MKTVFIVDSYKNPALLKFTQAKVMFDAKNQATNWADNIVTVDSLEQVNDQPGIIIHSGDFVTTEFRTLYNNFNQQVFASDDPNIIKFTPTYNYQITTRPPFDQGSKQLYILENLYKTVLRSRRLVYLDNTESYVAAKYNCKHLYGLASGWKTQQLAQSGNFETITVYDVCERQLEFQKSLHQQATLPDRVDIDAPVYGEYNPPQEIKDFWPTWHAIDVKFELLDLFSTPKFQDHSLVWVSNVFCYEPNIFNLGWETCKAAQELLLSSNPSCTIIE